MFIKCSFDEKEKLNYHRGKNCIEKLCKKLKESATEIVNHEKKEMVPLTHEENNFYNEQKICYKDDKSDINKGKVKDHCHYNGKSRGPVHSKCNLNYNIQKEIPIIIHS